MYKTICFLCLFLSLQFNSNAQITWEKLFVQSNTDVFRSVREVPSGGYIAVGYTSHWSNNDSDAFVVRLTATGDTIWTRTFNGGKKDILYKVINTSDGGFVMCGYKTTGLAPSDAYYMKLDANGNLLWQFTYGGTGTERAQDIIQTADGGYAMCGYTNSGLSSYNSFLVKIDANGGQTWNMKYGGIGYDDANSVKELPSGDFIMAGQTTTTGAGQGDIWLVLTNSSGVQQWAQTIGTTSPDNAEYIQLAAGGGFIICGSTQGLGIGSDDGYLVKTDDLGVVQWYKTYGGSAPDDFHTVENTSDGGFVVTGTTQSNALIISNQWLVKTDANGDSTWAYTFGGANHDHAYSGMQTSDGGYILCGYSGSFGFNYEDALVIKVDSQGLLYNHLIYTKATALVAPVNGSCGSANSTVTITVWNFGDTVMSVFPDTVVITGALSQTLGQTFTGTNVFPMNPINHTFTSTINTSAGGVFNFHCFTSNNNDVYPISNSCDSTITLNALPVPPLATGDTTCGPGTVTLTASSPYTIDWFMNATGGSSLNTGASYSPSISITTTYYVQASNACGTSTRTAVTAYVFPVTPPPGVTSAQRCGPGSVTLMASGSPISWWDSASGGLMVLGDFPSYVVTVSSTTIFYVEAGTGTACPSVREPVTATVNPLPDAGFTPSASAVCLGDAFQFTNTTTGAASYAWDFGDASGTSVQANPSYTYLQTGAFPVQLIATSAQNCDDTITIVVDVNPAPQVSFTASSTTGCLPFSVSFINATTNAINYLWTFGDGFTSTDVSPVHDYLTEGTFTVTLLATVGSCADSDSVVGMITTYASPVADLGPDIVTNSVTYQLDAGAGFTGYLWSNGATTQSITADTNGIYCVVVTGNNSCTDTDCVNVTLDASGVGDLSAGNYFIIYPNPAHDWFSIFNGLPAGKTGALKIYDVIGNEIYAGEIASGTMRVQSTGWRSGIYFVEISTSGTMLRKKLILY
jgi:PKD repeat protein